MIGKCFIPSLAQFHNKEPEKGAIILSLLGASLAASGISAVAGYNLYKKCVNMNGQEYTNVEYENAQNID